MGWRIGLHENHISIQIATCTFQRIPGVVEQIASASRPVLQSCPLLRTCFTFRSDSDEKICFRAAAVLFGPLFTRRPFVILRWETNRHAHKPRLNRTSCVLPQHIRWFRWLCLARIFNVLWADLLCSLFSRIPILVLNLVHSLAQWVGG